jgi:hypothetical protein
MKHQRQRDWLRVACACAVIGAIASAGATRARADDGVTCPDSVATPYTMQLRALTGPDAADLTVTLVADATTTCAVPNAIKKLQLKTFNADGTLASTRNVNDVLAPGGIVKNIDLGRMPRDRRVDADVLVQAATPGRTFMIHGTTTTLLRPDLVVREINAPKQALVGTPLTITAVIAEQNGDVGAVADVTLSAVPGVVDQVDVPPGGSTTVSFPATFGSPVPVDLTMTVGAATPAETDITNNAATATIEITGHQLAHPFHVLFPSLLGYGAQFNNHLYAPITPWPAGTTYGDVETKIKTLEPQLVRIFYNDNWDGNANGKFPDWQTNYASFVKVVQLAQESGATIAISFQNLGNVLTTPVGPPMAVYANVLEDLVRNHGLTNVRWAEVGNEPNSGVVTFDQYNALYRALNAELVARGLREQIHLMGGGLVENGANPARDHYAWMQLIAANMGDILDGYAEHVYWFYYNPGRLEYRLRDTWHLMNEVLPPEQQKPAYMMEFGIRGTGTCGSKPTFANLYYAVDPSCPEIWRTNIAGFQQLWFNVDSAQLGVAGTSKWDAFWGRYDNSSAGNQLYWMIGPPTEGSPVTPTYNAMSLLFHTTSPGWQIVGVEPWDASDWSVPSYRANLGDTTNDRPEQELVAYAGPNGELTVVGLDTHGKSLNTASTEPPSAYSIGGLPPNTTFNLAEWNAAGDGSNSIAEPVTTNGAGVARFDVPLQAAFALTTVPVS